MVSPPWTVGASSGRGAGRGASAQLAAQTSLFHLIGVTLRAYGSALAALPHILGERWRHRLRRRIGAWEFLGLIAEHRLRARDAAFAWSRM